MTSGPVSGSYADLLVRHAVGLVGPGESGPWRADRNDSVLRPVQQFAAEVQPGDAVLLRSGNSRLVAIGVVAGPYDYVGQFDDVNGWDLQHARRVRWFSLPEPHDFGSAIFGGCAAFGKITHPEALSLAAKLLNSPPSDWQIAPLPPLPEEEPELQDVPEALQHLVGLAQDLGGSLYWDSQRFGDLPLEKETVAHLVVPLLRALGWQEEEIALEWRRTDVAVFHSLPRTPGSCWLVVEAKKLGEGLDFAVQQARDYVRVTGADCDVLVTNGVRYRLHGRDRQYDCVAYANLCRLRQSATALFTRLRRP